MAARNNPLIVGDVYHIFNRSIAEFKIFNSETEFSRIVEAITYYQIHNQPRKLSNTLVSKNGKMKILNSGSRENKLVDVIAYCIMPTHFHLILKQLKENGVSIFMSNAINSYTRFFNLRRNRKGPLWEGKFRNVPVKTDEQLLHLTRYIHLNPVTAYLVKKPEEWIASSYREYLSNSRLRICTFEDVLDICPNSYKCFVEDRISYQKNLALIKKLTMD